MGLSPGKCVGPYEILAPLGAGGMGEVYRARDSKLGRDVAIKILPSNLAHDVERMARLEREAKLLASLNHPNIAAIYGFEDSVEPALVMELVEGPTLADCLRKGPIPLDDALPIARQICEALEYAHERGVVHRDLKPANVKVTADGTVKLLDFGLAKALEGDFAMPDNSNSPTLTAMATQAGIILGTAAYMPPEQARCKPVDRRADIWAFGCVLYEMLTGKTAFCGETVTDTLADVIKIEPKWSELPASTPAHIRVLLRRCLQKNPRQRLRDIGDARISLEEVLSGSPESFSTAGVAFPFGRRVLPWIVATLAGALLSGLIVWKIVAKPPKSEMHFSAITNFAGVQAQPAISPDGRSIAFVSNRDGHHNIYVGLTGGGSLVQLTNDANLKARPAWAPDGTTVAYARLNEFGIWDIWEVPSLGGTSRRVILNATDPAWSPDGHSLVYENLSDHGLWVAGASGENPHRVAPGGPGEWRDTEPRFSPDGRAIVFSSRGNGPYGELQLVDVASGKIRYLTNDDALALSPAWSPSGAYIYFASSRGGTMNIWKVAAKGGEPEQITAGQGDDAELDVSSDGKKIVFSTWRQNVNIAQINPSVSGQQEPRSLTSDPARNQVDPTYSPDGKYIAYFSNLKGAEKETIWVANADGSSPIQLVHDDRIDVFPSWEPDSRYLVYQAESAVEHGDEYRRVSISGGAPEVVMKDARDRLFDVGSDGRLLFRSNEEEASAFDPRNGSRSILGSVRRSVHLAPLRWSPDERLVAYVVVPHQEDDGDAGIWVTDFKNPPRQIFRGWVDWWLARGPGDDIYFLEARPDLNAVLCKVRWDGTGLSHYSAILPMIRSYWVDPIQSSQDHFSVSPDGKHIAFERQTVLSANIGMIENVR